MSSAKTRTAQGGRPPAAKAPAKATGKSAASGRPIPGERWYELVSEFPLRPITSDDELKQAIALIDRIGDLKTRTQDDEDYREVLGGLIYAYEEEHEPSDATPADMLRHLLDSRNVSQADCARGTGLSEASVSQILLGRRKPSRRAIKALSTYFKVAPALFLELAG